MADKKIKRTHIREIEIAEVKGINRSDGTFELHIGHDDNKVTILHLEMFDIRYLLDVMSEPVEAHAEYMEDLKRSVCRQS